MMEKDHKTTGGRKEQLSTGVQKVGKKQGEILLGRGKTVAKGRKTALQRRKSFQKKKEKRDGVKR